jgi:demethylmenaquinone methyltransferase/2-methoxy-6-polyprenyl-1,4-benzoquinol methylase
MFDAIAHRYDFLNHFLSAGVDRRWRRRAIRALSLTGRERVLDLCTGTADLAIAARAAPRPAARVVGVDFAAAMLEVGRTKIERQRLAGTVQLVRGDATRIPLADESMDAVTVGFGVRNIEDMKAACAEICRVLIPGGRLVVLEFAIPTARAIRGAYLWYFNSVLPRVGRVLSRHHAAYEYLPASVGAFAAPHEFARLLGDSGFTRVVATPLTFGIVYMFTAARK